MYSILDNSFFQRSHIPVRVTIHIMWHFICEVRAGCTAMSLGVPIKSVIQQNRFLRDICSWKLLQENELFLLGMMVLVCLDFNNDFCLLLQEVLDTSFKLTRVSLLGGNTTLVVWCLKNGF